MRKVDVEAERAGVVAIADDDAVHSKLLSMWLEREGYVVRCAPDGQACLELVREELVDVVLLDIHMPRLDGLQTLERLRSIDPRLPAIMLTGESAVETVVRAMQTGAYDYVAKPANRVRLLSTLKRAIEHYRMQLEAIELMRMVSKDPGYVGLIASSEAMEPVFRHMDRLVTSDITVVIHGESGTGKELIARAIHEHSSRAKRGAFVAVNCAAVPESLQESAFFGHVKGAFTGAERAHSGHFERADKGTLFLDEVAELTPELQASLLRALQERRVQPIGSEASIEVDVRVLAASNRRLLDEVEAGRFREDLYYRLAVFELDLPPLRERTEDIPLLVRHFVEELAHQTRRERVELSDQALSALSTYEWPGNVRELRNAMQRAVVLADDVIHLEHLPPRVQVHYRDLHGGVVSPPGRRMARSPDRDEVILPLGEVERRAILRAH
ncbi:MAG: sigma-54 dependent transcriptional regulator, partial [Myxococcota bacterium]